MRMGQSRCTWMWAKNEVHDLSSPSSVLQTLASRSAAMNSWEEQAFAEDVSGSLGGCVWPPRSYSCSFCRRDFRSAQALGGHMNVHRRDRAALLKQQSPTEVVPQQIHASKPCTSFDGTRPASRVSTTLWYINPNPELSSDAGLLVLSPSSHVTRVSSSPSPPKKVNNYEQERVFFSPVVDSDDHEILDSIKNSKEKNSKSDRAKKQDPLTDKDLSRGLNLAVCRREKRHTSSDEEVTSNCKRRRLMMEAKPNLSFFPKLLSTVNDRSGHLPRSETMFKVLIKSGLVDGELDLELRLGGALI